MPYSSDPRRKVRYSPAGAATGAEDEREGAWADAAVIMAGFLNDAERHAVYQNEARAGVAGA